MSKRTVQTPHRPKRDTASQEKDLREARQEARKLRIQLAQIRKQLVRALNGRETEADPQVVETPVEDVTEEKLTCPSCGELGIREIDAGLKVYLVCATCKWRKAK